MKYNFKLTILAILLLVAQGIIDNYFNITTYLSIALLPFIILMLPYQSKTIWTILIAFILGIVTDMLGNGILGINSAALTAAAVCRKEILNISIKKEILNTEQYPSSTTIKISYFSLYAAIFLAIYFMVYVPLDNAGFTPFYPILLRFAISLATNLLLMILLFIITGERKK